MLKDDAITAFQRVRTLFPDFKPDDDLAKFWVKELCKYHDLPELIDAIEQHRATSRYKNPTIDGIASRFRIHTPKTNGDRGPVNSGVYIQCIETKQHSRLGQWKPLIYSRVLPPYDQILRYAEVMKEKHEQMYGGKWVVVEPPKTEADPDGLTFIMETRANLQAKPIDEWA